MEIIKSGIIYGAGNAQSDVYDFLKSNYDYWYSTDDENYILWLTNKIYLAFGYNGSYFSLDLKDIGMGWDNVRSCHYSSQTYYTAAMYKVNSDCFGLAIYTHDYIPIGYSKSCCIMVDSYTVNKVKHRMLISRPSMTDNAFIADGSTPNTVIYTPFRYDGGDSNVQSYKNYWVSGQVAKFVSPFGGQEADNLYNILLANQMNNFVIFNDKKWLFTNGFALLCED